MIKSRRNQRSHVQRSAPMSRINVTPFVDVMLVLLIVFMIAAPLLSVGIPVELPQSDESVNLPADQQFLTVSLTKDGRIYLQDSEIILEDLKVRLQSLRHTGNSSDGKGEASSVTAAGGSIFVRGDSLAQYGIMAEIIAIVRSSGFQRIGFITENKPES